MEMSDQLNAYKGRDGSFFFFLQQKDFLDCKMITSACRNSPLGLKTKTLSLPWKYWSGNTWHQKSYFPGFKMPRISFKIVCKSLSYLVPFERVVWSTGKAGNNSKINSNFLTSLASLIILEIEGRGHRVHNLCLIIIVNQHHHNRNPSTPAWFLFLPNEKDPAHEWERALLASIPSSVNSYNTFYIYTFYIYTFRTNTNS